MRFETTVELPADAAAVWAALTEPGLTKQYFYDCEAISDWKVGSPLIFKFTSDGKEIIPVKGVITVVEPNRRLAHTCYATEFENEPDEHTVVTYTLKSQGEATLLSVTQGEFPDEDAYEKHQNSWDHVLNGLKALLERQNAS